MRSFRYGEEYYGGPSCTDRTILNNTTAMTLTAVIKQG